MRILQFGKYYPPHLGGMERVIYNLTHGLNRAGHRCDVLCANEKKVESIEQHSDHTVYRAKSFGELFSMAVAPGLIRMLGKLAPHYDIIHFHHPDPMSALAIFLCRPKAKIVVHWHLDIVKQKVAYFFYRPLERWLLSRANLIITTSQKYLDSSMPLKDHKQKCVAVPIGIEIPDEAPIPAPRLNGFEDRKVVFALGRFTEYKGFEYLIESARYLDDSFQILIGGDGRLATGYREIIHKFGLEKRVTLLGRLTDEEVNTYMAGCDIFCLPSITRNEAFGLVMLEAMGFRRPVVATNIPGSGTSWVNAQGVTGLNVSTHDPQALADAFKEILSDPARAKAFGDNGRTRLLSEFSVNKMIDRVIDAYSTLNIKY